jgi:hypothetical protein
MTSRVYKITNTIDDMIYIGSSKQHMSKRMGQHRTSCRKGVNTPLYQHMRLLGIENFRICPVEVLQDVDTDELRMREDFHIKEFDTVKNGLNGRYEVGTKCEHGVRRSECIPCGGASICEHGRIRTHCIPCGGVSICEHGRQRSSCKPCGGSQICEHGRERNKCKDCGGASICEHGRIRSACIPCGGVSICEHGRLRSACIPCGGSQICEHKKHKRDCKACNPHKCQICDKTFGGKSKYTRHLKSKAHLHNQFMAMTEAETREWLNQIA